ncbi:MAG: DUF2442 domain-containing protein [Elusimicrobiota bacterium]|jgi:hypothetical protein|nr:DUF2442 domain-containing protein [Elusimicrobiota bacterium]
MFYKIKSVQPLSQYNLFVEFENNETREYDVSRLFDEIEEFKAFATVKGLFEQVKVDKGGYGIMWNSKLDLSCNELYENGRKLQ